MTISRRQKAEITRLFYAEHLSCNAIAESLNIHHDTVKSHLNALNSTSKPARRYKITDPYQDFIEESLNKYPKLRATRIASMLKERGFKGSISTVRACVQKIRPGCKKAFLPLAFIEGEQAQVDWAHFGTMNVENTSRKFYCFVMVLAYSRAIFAHFTFDQRMASFLWCHVLAFRYFGGISRSLLYDNLKSVVLNRDGRDIEFNPVFMEFSGHYRFATKACNPRAGWEKGRVERAIRYVRDNFYYGRSFRDINDLNQQLNTQRFRE
jgi:transposase